jgi:hypothetical protein
MIDLKWFWLKFSMDFTLTSSRIYVYFKEYTVNIYRRKTFFLECVPPFHKQMQNRLSFLILDTKLDCKGTIGDGHYAWGKNFISSSKVLVRVNVNFKQKFSLNYKNFILNQMFITLSYTVFMCQFLTIKTLVLRY